MHRNKTTIPSNPQRLGRYWIFDDGSYLPVVSGAEGEGGEGDEGDGAKEVKLTQEQLNNLLAEAKRKAKGSTEGELKKLLGVEDLSAVKGLVEAARAAEDKNKTDLERATSEATTEKQKREAAEASAAELRVTSMIEKALIGEGLSVAAAERTRNMITVPTSADAEAIKAEIAALRKDMPQLFPTQEGGAGQPPATPPPAPGRPPTQPSGGTSPTDAARSLLYERHPELKKS
jgi:hypothetical protein